MTLSKEQKLNWAGRIVSVLAVLPFIPSAIMKIKGGPEMTQGMAHFGFSESIIMTLAILEILCIVVYAIPATAILGAILFTGYLGGAICTHLRMGEAVYMQVAIGVLLWLGLYLREPRLRTLIPARCRKSMV